MKELRIGMIGYGFMGKTHSNAYVQAAHFFKSDHKPVLKALCARNAEKAKPFAENWGYESVETDWRELLKRDDIDVVDICTPNNLHKEIAIAAAKAGKMILCEKPLAMNAAEGEETSHPHHPFHESWVALHHVAEAEQDHETDHQRLEQTLYQSHRILLICRHGSRDSDLTPRTHFSSL